MLNFITLSQSTSSQISLGDSDDDHVESSNTVETLVQRIRREAIASALMQFPGDDRNREKSPENDEPRLLRHVRFNDLPDYDDQSEHLTSARSFGEEGEAKNEMATESITQQMGQVGKEIDDIHQELKEIQSDHENTSRASPLKEIISKSANLGPADQSVEPLISAEHSNTKVANETDDIKVLFNVLKTDLAREYALGFPSYESLHGEYPSVYDKMLHLITRGIQFGNTGNSSIVCIDWDDKPLLSDLISWKFLNLLDCEVLMGDCFFVPRDGWKGG